MKQIISFLSVLLLFSYCTEKIDIDLNTLDQRRLVVDAWITNDSSNQYIDLSYTVDFFEDEPAQKATGASVQIINNNTSTIFNESAPGIYDAPSGFNGKVGQSYTLNIDVDKEQYTSFAYLDSVMSIDSLSYLKLDDKAPPSPPRGRKKGYDLLMSIKELPGTGDYYAIKTYKNGVLDSDTLYEYAFFDDQLIDGYDYKLISFTSVDAEIGDVFDIELMSISEEAYEAYRAMFSESFRGGIFDAPPANVPSNISNGALGIFNASAISKGSVTIKD
ncbi:MAG: hypothetical protein ACJAUV_001367 [Flavobacteriales bacterium]|jgi:hypothetical protein